MGICAVMQLKEEFLTQGSGTTCDPGRTRTRGPRMSPEQGKAAHHSSKRSYFGRLGFGFAEHDGDVAASALPWPGGKLCSVLGTNSVFHRADVEVELGKQLRADDRLRTT